MHDMRHASSLDDVLAESRPVGHNHMSLSYANVISELASVRKGVLAFMTLAFLLPLHAVLSSNCVLSNEVA